MMEHKRMRGRLLIVYPTLGNIFYFHLATRLSDAASELGVETRLIGSSHLDCLCGSWATSVPALIVNPTECFLSGGGMMGFLTKAPFRAAVLAECVGTMWYRNTLTLDMDFDLVIDVGFLDQGSLRLSEAIPYRLLFNAPLPNEIESIAEAQPGSRCTNWALIGHVTPERLVLAEQLSSTLGSGGFLFLPQLRPVRPLQGMLSPAALHRVLQATNFYVWCSHHTLPYYESFRFLDAAMCGAIPCKIDNGGWAELSGFPNIYRSVEDLSHAIGERSPKGLFEASKDFALSNGTLTEHLAELLCECLAFTR